MEKVKSTKEHTIYKKASGRYAVLGRGHKWINGDKKVQVLAKEGLLKHASKKKAEEKAAE